LGNDEDDDDDETAGRFGAATEAVDVVGSESAFFGAAVEAAEGMEDVEAVTLALAPPAAGPVCPS
jgi:hypothetical protein